MPSLELEINNQTGHNCKVTAIVNLESYFAKKYNYSPIPLHKNSATSHFVMASMRQVAKKFDSKQGELLEIQQLKDILNYIGYESDIHDFKNDEIKFRTIISNQIAQKNPVIICFAVDQITEYPTLNYHEKDKESNEHAAVISGYNPTNDTVELIYWGKKYETTLSTLFASTHSLPEKRKRECYQSVKNYGFIKKYELVREAKNDNNNEILESIQPKEQSGFHAKLITVKRPNKEHIVSCRKKVCYEMIDSLIAYSIKRIINKLPKPHRKIAIEQGEIYKTTVGLAVTSFAKNQSKPQLLATLKNAEKKYCHTILGLDSSTTNKIKRLVKKIMVNLLTHLLGIVTLGFGFYFNYQHKVQTGNWLFFSKTTPEQSLRSLQTEMLLRL